MKFYVQYKGVPLSIEADVSKAGNEIDGGLIIKHAGMEITEMVETTEIWDDLVARFYEALNEHRGGR